MLLPAKRGPKEGGAAAGRNGENRGVEDGWQALYRSEWMSLYALQVVPAIFLLGALVAGPGRSARNPRARFVHIWALVFALETWLDPFVTGPIVANAPASVATGASLLFVLLGDFRVLLLALFLGVPAAGLVRSAWRAAALTAAVPVAALLLQSSLEALLGALSPQVLWLCHESLFVALALWLRARLRSSDRYVAEVLAYAALYYALWASADVLILLGVEAGWLLRILPNQLYYAFFVPFAYLRFDWQGAAEPAQRSPAER